MDTGGTPSAYHHFRAILRRTDLSSAYSTREGLAFIPFGAAFDRIIDPAEPKSRTAVPRHLDGRIEANKRRKGQRLERNGKFIRVNDICRRISQFVKAIGGIHRVKLFTFTFPAGTPDAICFKVRNIVLTRWRTVAPDLAYLWVAERQKNGTAHFHLLSDRWIDIGLLNKWTRAALRSFGNEVPWPDPDAVNRYNGVDIARREDGQKDKLYTERDAERYVSKYLTKSDLSSFRQPWHCSRNISRLSIKVRLSIQSAFAYLLMNLRDSRRDWSSLEVFQGDNFVWVKWPSLRHERISKILEAHNRSKWRDPNYHLPSLSPAPIAICPKEVPLPSSRGSGGYPQQMQLDLGPMLTLAPRRGRPFITRAQVLDTVTPAL